MIKYNEDKINKLNELDELKKELNKIEKIDKLKKELKKEDYNSKKVGCYCIYSNKCKFCLEKRLKERLEKEAEEEIKVSNNKKCNICLELMNSLHCDICKKYICSFSRCHETISCKQAIFFVCLNCKKEQNYYKKEKKEKKIEKTIESLNNLKREYFNYRKQKIYLKKYDTLENTYYSVYDNDLKYYFYYYEIAILQKIHNTNKEFKLKQLKKQVLYYNNNNIKIKYTYFENRDILLFYTKE